MNVDSKKIDAFLVELLTQVGENLREDSIKKMSVGTKKNRNDLVTNFDKKTEKFINTRIKEAYPEATIVSEEGYGDLVKDMSGLVFFVDPIDGTMNFVKRGDDFASMIGVYIDGEPLIGAIIDVMDNEIYHGGKEIGLFIDQKPIDIPKNLPLIEGLVDISAPMALANKFDVQEVVKKSSGLRVYGSAGIIFGHLLTGKEVMYMSYLAPWDLAAGRVLCEAAGMSVVSIDDSPINMLESQVVIVGTQKVASEALKTLKAR
ncbi:inositol monophosphatase family protein [Companilactobacillus farciminis]|jgi:myo-inositol-1(or 4)-monophosphatase|uniref:inositol monophosphatase family protein n=1 Tax=Companilactobacillus farciminis TaxID=1612 RepID=UPI00191546C9|nr:inositol monophosphatase family protein [Companilactobacillus farciminis]